MFKKITFILMTTVVVACGSEKKEEKSEKPEEKKEEANSNPTGMQLSDLSFMAGNWMDAAATAEVFQEKWIIKNDSLIQIIGYFTNGTDTAIMEVIKVQMVNGVLNYIPKVDGQNGGKEVSFALQDGSTNDSICFANQGHDFPQEISYVKKADDSVMVFLKGIDEAKKPKFYNLILKKQ